MSLAAHSWTHLSDEFDSNRGPLLELDVQRADDGVRISFQAAHLQTLLDALIHQVSGLSFGP